MNTNLNDPVQICRTIKYNKRACYYRNEGAKYHKAILRLLRKGALVTWECLDHDPIVDETILLPALEAQARGRSSIEDPQQRSKAEEIIRRTLGNMLCDGAFDKNINKMQWVINLADVDPFKDIVLAKWSISDRYSPLKGGDSALIAAVKGRASIEVFEWLLSHGADKTVTDVEHHSAAYRARVMKLSGEMQSLLHTPGCDEETREEGDEEIFDDDDLGGLFG